MKSATIKTIAVGVATIIIGNIIYKLMVEPKITTKHNPHSM